MSTTTFISETTETTETTEPSTNIGESDTENEFFDACDSLDLKLQSISEQAPSDTNNPNLEIKGDNNQDDDDDDQVLIEQDSDDSDFEKMDMFKKFDEKFNLKSDSKIESENKFIPLHERLNAEQAEKNAEEEKEEYSEDKDETSEINPNSDPYFVDEAQLEKEQASLTEQEKQDKLKEGQTLKQSGNDLFKQEKFTEALEFYTQALKCCPIEFKKERSIFYSNRSICYLKMKENLKCINECTKSIELDPLFIKPLLRRAECNQIEDKLDDSLSDYKKLNELEPKYEYRQKCFELEELIKVRNEKLKDEMMGKLKELGNMVLKPFGLSTNNFQFVQDPATGSYSVNFKQN